MLGEPILKYEQGGARFVVGAPYTATPSARTSCTVTRYV